MNESRLINANDLKKSINDWASNNLYVEDIEYIQNLIDNQPTAYDIDKVVEQLEAESFKIDSFEYEDEEVVNLDDAIEIVRNGGGSDA